MLCVVDYGVGNLYSLCSSLAAVGAEAVVSGDPEVIAKADKIILPGVGAFGDAAAKLRENGLDKLIIERAPRSLQSQDLRFSWANAGVPLMGICLGMQMLFDESREFGCHKGLGLIPGKVISMEGVIAPGLKIPQMGWNALHFPNDELKDSSPVFRDVDEGEFVYFVHSYYASECEADTVAVCDCGVPITAAVVRGNVMGCQFHPEKSSKAGLKILKNFCEGDFGGVR